MSDINAKAEAAAREISKSVEIASERDYGAAADFSCDVATVAAIIVRHIAPLVEALEAVNDVHGAPCRYDHHGLCQTHSLRSVERDGKWVPECEMELVRKALAAWTAAKDATP